MGNSDQQGPIRVEIRPEIGNERYGQNLIACIAVATVAMGIAVLSSGRQPWAALPFMAGCCCFGAGVWWLVDRGDRAYLVGEGDTLVIQNTFRRYEVERSQIRELRPLVLPSPRLGCPPAFWIVVVLVTGRRIRAEVTTLAAKNRRRCDFVEVGEAIDAWLKDTTTDGPTRSIVIPDPGLVRRPPIWEAVSVRLRRQSRSPRRRGAL